MASTSNTLLKKYKPGEYEDALVYEDGQIVHDDVEEDDIDDDYNSLIIVEEDVIPRNRAAVAEERRLLKLKEATNKKKGLAVKSPIRYKRRAEAEGVSTTPDPEVEPIPKFNKRRRTVMMLTLPNNLRDSDLLSCNLRVGSPKYNVGRNVFVDRPINFTKPTIRLALWIPNSTRPLERTGSDANDQQNNNYSMVFDKEMICILRDALGDIELALKAAENDSFGGYVLNMGNMCYAVVVRGQARVMFRKWWIKKEDSYKDLPLKPTAWGIHLDSPQMERFKSVLLQHIKELVPEMETFEIICDANNTLADSKHVKRCTACLPKGKLPLEITLEKLYSLSLSESYQ